MKKRKDDVCSKRLLPPVTETSTGLPAVEQAPVSAEAGLLEAAIVMGLRYPNYYKYFSEAARKPAGGNE